jgi:hypothetical protein
MTRLCVNPFGRMRQERDTTQICQVKSGSPLTDGDQEVDTGLRSAAGGHYPSKPNWPDPGAEAPSLAAAAAIDRLAVRAEPSPGRTRSPAWNARSPPANVGTLDFVAAKDNVVFRPPRRLTDPIPKGAGNRVHHRHVGCRRGCTGGPGQVGGRQSLSPMCSRTAQASVTSRRSFQTMS